MDVPGSDRCLDALMPQKRQFATFLEITYCLFLENTGTLLYCQSHQMTVIWGGRGDVRHFFKQSKTLFSPLWTYIHLNENPPNLLFIHHQHDFLGEKDPLICTISRYGDFVLIGVVKHVDRVKLLTATVLWRVIRKKSTPHYGHLALPWRSRSAAWLKDN